MIGESILHYKIIEELGSGGMGIVHKARDTKLDRWVAIKFLPSPVAAHLDARNRFKLEAKIAATLSHANVATIYDLEEVGDDLFIVMEFVDGTDLRKILGQTDPRQKAPPLPIETVLRFAEQIALGLQAAHEKGIVHGDIKPDNVLINSEGQVKITDFGLARLTRGEFVPQTHPTMGTIPYMSPEQVRGEPIDLRTDIWSWGVILYEMTSGTRPFSGDYEQSIMYSILHEDPSPLPPRDPALPQSLAHIIRKSLAKNPTDRYANCEQLLNDLQLGCLPAQTARGKKIAVLPFLNINRDPADEYFSDGMMEDILTQLVKIGDLKVISRTTMMTYKGSHKALRQIAEELHADVVLEGSVRREAGTLRISVQLIDANTDEHIWAETFDRDVSQVLVIQSEIAQRIAVALQAQLSPAERLRLMAPAPIDVEAYNLLLRGVHHLTRGSRPDVDQAVELFKQALSLEPDNARGWAELATAYARQADAGALSTDEGYAKARQAAQRALALDDQLAQGHEIMGWIKRSYDWDWMGAEAECRKALRLAPGDVIVIRNMANLEKTLGRFDRAIILMQQAAELDPKKVPIYTSLGLLSMYANRLEEAVAAYRKAIELNPQYPASHTFLGLVYLLQGEPVQAIAEMQLEHDDGWRLYGLAQALHGAGRKAEAEEALSAVIEKYGSESAYQVAEAYAYRGEIDRAFEWLERAYASRDGGLSELKGDPFMKRIESDPRYTAFLKRMKLPA